MFIFDFTSLYLYSYFISFFFFFNDTATTEIYTLSLHDALPIYPGVESPGQIHTDTTRRRHSIRPSLDRKSTRLNSSHQIISYAVFCLKKKNHKETISHATHTLITLYHIPFHDTKRTLDIT